MLVLVWISLLIVLAACGYICLKRHYSYWERHKVPHIKPTFFIGNLGEFLCMRKSPAEFIQTLYNHPDAVGKPFVGIHVFHTPAIFVRDPDLIKRILIKDFNKFSNRYSNSDYKGDPLGSQNIFFLKNPAWKEVRLKLSPFFTSTKIKQMFTLIEQVGRNMNTHLLQKPIEHPALNAFTLELKEFCALYTTDVIATVAFGVQANSFQNPDGEFRHSGREVFRFTLKRAAEFTMVFFLPRLVPYLGFKVVPADSTKFLRTTINYVLEQREKSGQTRNDLIDLLIEFKNATKAQADTGKFVFDGDILVAQAVLFFTAGFESSSATMSFALYELAMHAAMQQRLRAEIKAAVLANNGLVTSKLIESLEYMHMVIQEVLRLYPPLPFLDRECTLPAGSEGYSLAPFADYTMPAGMPVYIGVYGIHMDPKYYVRPEQFEPERFAPANKKLLTPYTYMPFGLGPHACIGERFGILQTKIGLVYFLLNHFVTSCPKTPAKMQLDRKAIILQAEGGIHLNVVRDPLIY